jgi:hypothetical protein
MFWNDNAVARCVTMGGLHNITLSSLPRRSKRRYLHSSSLRIGYESFLIHFWRDQLKFVESIRIVRVIYILVGTTCEPRGSLPSMSTCSSSSSSNSSLLHCLASVFIQISQVPPAGDRCVVFRIVIPRSSTPVVFAGSVQNC